MASNVKAEVGRLLVEGKTPAQIHIELEQKGFSGQEIAEILDSSGHVQSATRIHSDERNSSILSAREIFDRVGYGSATPQFINILFWLSARTHPYIFFILGILNGLKAIFSVAFSNILRGYDERHRMGKNTISASGIIFGFSFLLLSFGLMIRNIWIFSAAFLIGSVSAVAYGDLYNRFIGSLIRKERRSKFLRGIAHWGILITALSLLFSGYLLDMFPMTGKLWEFTLFGKSFSWKIYGYLLTFEITAFSFILAGYVTSLLSDKKELREYKFFHFLREQHQQTKKQIRIFWSNKYVTLMTIASVITGLLQILVTAYSGVAIYQILSGQTDAPFLFLAVMYTVAVLASFLGPLFTGWIHRSTGLAPTLVFGTLLMAILPFVLVFQQHMFAIAAALVVNVIGGAITGFGQGLLAKKLLSDQDRAHYFQAQAYLMVIPYILLVPVAAWITNAYGLDLMFMIVGIGLAAVVMPIYFSLVCVSQNLKL